jgi:hypothetical protein
LAESIQHLKLVESIITYIGKNFVGVNSVVTLHDLPGRIGCEKPPKIGSYRPDIYATDAPTTVTILGEAKTQSDLDSTHTRSQIRTFIRYLQLQQNGVFILATPWQAKVKGRELVTALSVGDFSSRVRVIVIDDLNSNGD